MAGGEAIAACRPVVAQRRLLSFRATSSVPRFGFPVCNIDA